MINEHKHVLTLLQNCKLNSDYEMNIISTYQKELSTLLAFQNEQNKNCIPHM
jgi:hypothetical protein